MRTVCKAETDGGDHCIDTSSSAVLLINNVPSVIDIIGVVAGATHHGICTQTAVENIVPAISD